jgi:hypothetical protein
LPAPHTPHTHHTTRHARTHATDTLIDAQSLWQCWRRDG